MCTSYCRIPFINRDSIKYSGSIVLQKDSQIKQLLWSNMKQRNGDLGLRKKNKHRTVFRLSRKQGKKNRRNLSVFYSKWVFWRLTWCIMMYLMRCSAPCQFKGQSKTKRFLLQGSNTHTVSSEYNKRTKLTNYWFSGYMTYLLTQCYL